MWIALPTSFLSVVAPRSALHGPHLLVRARAVGDIERVFPHARVAHTPKSDYAYRAGLPRTLVAETLAASIEAIDYPNFKDTVRESDRHNAYLESWLAMCYFQRSRARARLTSRGGDC